MIWSPFWNHLIPGVRLWQGREGKELLRRSRPGSSAAWKTETFSESRWTFDSVSQKVWEFWKEATEQIWGWSEEPDAVFNEKEEDGSVFWNVAHFNAGSGHPWWWWMWRQGSNLQRPWLERPPGKVGAALSPPLSGTLQRSSHSEG